MIELIKVLTDSEILALTLYGEARGEPIEGQIAVANVIKNRSRVDGKSIKEICLAPRQFSCWNEDDPNYVLLKELAQKLLAGQAIDDLVLTQCMWVTNGTLRNSFLDNTKGALNYITIGLFTTNKPSWARNSFNETKLGHHIFFNC